MARCWLCRSWDRLGGGKKGLLRFLFPSVTTARTRLYTQKPRETPLARSIARLSQQKWTETDTVFRVKRHDRKLLFSPTRLARRTGLSRPTIRRARAKLIAEGWYAPPKAKKKRVRWQLSGQTVVIPAELIMSTNVKAQAKIVYGVLRSLLKRSTSECTFAYVSLAETMNLNAKTDKRAVCHLAEWRWLEVEQANKHAPIRFRPRNPVKAKHIAEVLNVGDRLRGVPYYGEALMQAVLSAPVASRSCHDGSTPDILTNPLTDESLEYDRFYYHHWVAFEFNGQQHYSVTNWFDEEVVAAQKERDQMKREMSKEKGVTLIEVRGEELGWQTLLHKIGKRLPLRRGVRCNRMLINYLERRCESYRERAELGWAPTEESTPEQAATRSR
jgi:hypothetical protein